MTQRGDSFGRIIVFALAGLASADLFAQTDPGWTTAWPNLGEATSLLSDGSNPARLFAGTELGLAASTDGGQTWSVLDGSPQSLRTLALDPSNPSRLFGGSDAGVFLTTDGGAHFSLAHSFPAKAIAIDATHPNIVYSGGSGTMIRKSTDGGATWTSTDLLTRADAIAALIVDPHDGTRVLAGLDAQYFSYYYLQPGLALSTDSAGTWRFFLSPGSPVETVQALAFDPRSNGVVYAANGSLVYRSSDGGSTWTAGTLPLGSWVTSLLVDSLTPDTVYAGTNQGVFRSTDGGAHWAPLAILPSMDVRAVALDAPGQVLHAATAAGVYETSLSAAAPGVPCQPAVDTLCLLGGRLRVRARAMDYRTGRFATGHAVAETDAFGYFSLPDFTGDASLPEILFKMVDAGTPPWNADWVFYGGLTDLWYVVTVTDTLTGAVRSYENVNGFTCGGADTAAFPDPPPAHASVSATPPPLQASGDALSLLADRFQLTLSAIDPHTGAAITGRAIPRQDGFGYFSLPDLTGDASLPEVFVKMLDGRALTGTFWLFLTGLTDVPYTVTVLDTATGAVQNHQPPGAFCGVADTEIAAGAAAGP
jgi:photosystem II stability/assembly factor-like uncharacterized protein